MSGDNILSTLKQFENIIILFVIYKILFLNFICFQWI